MDALAKAEHAHWLCRKAAELGRENKYEEAEVSAMRGVNELKERSVSTWVFNWDLITECYDSVLMVPEITLDGVPEYDADLAKMA